MHPIRKLNNHWMEVKRIFKTGWKKKVLERSQGQGVNKPGKIGVKKSKDLGLRRSNGYQDEGRNTGQRHVSASSSNDNGLAKICLKVNT